MSNRVMPRAGDWVRVLASVEFRVGDMHDGHVVVSDCKVPVFHSSVDDLKVIYRPLRLGDRVRTIAQPGGDNYEMTADYQLIDDVRTAVVETGSPFRCGYHHANDIPIDGKQTCAEWQATQKKAV